MYPQLCFGASHSCYGVCSQPVTNLVLLERAFWPLPDVKDLWKKVADSKCVCKEPKCHRVGPTGCGEKVTQRANAAPMAKRGGARILKPPRG